MQTFTRIQRDETRVIRDIAMEALKRAFAETNISVTPERGSFDGGNCVLKFQFALVVEGGSALTREAQDFTRYASIYGFREDDLGREFTSANRAYKIVGLAPSSRKFPILVEQVGTRIPYKFPAARVLAGLGRAL